MSKFSNYTGTIQLISGIKQANNQDFALLESHAIQVNNDGKRLDSVVNELAHAEVIASITGIISDSTGDPISEMYDGLYLLDNIDYNVSDEVAIISLSGNVNITVTVQNCVVSNLSKFQYGTSYVFITSDNTSFTMQLRYDVSDKMDKFATIEEYQGDQMCIKSITDDLIILSGNSSSGIYLRSDNDDTVVRSSAGLILSSFDPDNSLEGTRLTLGTDYIKFNGPSGKYDIPTVVKGVANPTTDYEAANKAYVDNKVASIVNSAPETLDTLQELAKALGDDPNFATTMATELGKKVNKSDVDQSYNPESVNPQSGTAVAEAIKQNVHTTNISEIKITLDNMTDFSDETVYVASKDILVQYAVKPSEETEDPGFGIIDSSGLGTPDHNFNSARVLIKKGSIIKFSKFSGSGNKRLTIHAFGSIVKSRASVGLNPIAEIYQNYIGGFRNRTSPSYASPSGEIVPSEIYVDYEQVALFNNAYYNLVNGESSYSLRTSGSQVEAGAYKLGQYAFAEGEDTMASSDSQHVQGKYNIDDNTGKYAHIIGNGTYNQRSNAHTVDWQGNAWYAGDVYVGSTYGTNKDGGSKKLATEKYVDNAISSITPGESGAITEFDTLILNCNAAIGAE